MTCSKATCCLRLNLCRKREDQLKGHITIDSRSCKSELQHAVPCRCSKLPRAHARLETWQGCHKAPSCRAAGRCKAQKAAGRCLPAPVLVVPAPAGGKPVSACATQQNACTALTSKTSSWQLDSAVFTACLQCARLAMHCNGGLPALDGSLVVRISTIHKAACHHDKLLQCDV